MSSSSLAAVLSGLVPQCSVSLSVRGSLAELHFVLQLPLIVVVLAAAVVVAAVVVAWGCSVAGIQAEFLAHHLMPVCIGKLKW